MKRLLITILLLLISVIGSSQDFTTVCYRVDDNEYYTTCYKKIFTVENYWSQDVITYNKIDKSLVVVRFIEFSNREYIDKDIIMRLNKVDNFTYRMFKD